MRGTVGAMTGDAGRQFEAYDSSHLTVLAIFAVGAVGVIWLGIVMILIAIGLGMFAWRLYRAG